MESHIEYAGYIIKEGRNGDYFLLKNGANAMPAAAIGLTKEDAFMAADVLEAVEGDDRRFWHLWRAIRGHGDSLRKV